jgi:hypothetical protein
VIQGSAKAWVNFNGSTAAIRASYNVTSITKNGAGDYRVNLTNAMADVNYAISVATDDPAVRQFIVSGSVTTSTYGVRCQNSGGSNADTSIFCTSILR